MRHIESSILIPVKGIVDAAAVKYSLIQRLRNAFHVETVGEGNEAFAVSATGKTTSYVFNLNVVIRTEEGRVRIMADGGNEVAMATRIFYLLGMLMVIGLNFFPSTQERGDSVMLLLQAMFFLVVGGFIIYDMNKKFDEPQMLLDRILKSVETEYA